MQSENPLLNIDFEPALELLGDDYYDPVAAAEFPTHILRFRNDSLLQTVGLSPQAVADDNFIEAFGKFQNAPRPFLALRYHGYQFGEYNAALGDGRGFLYGQVRGYDQEIYDLGTKGSGTTPYSRGGDGRLTLKGGMREVIAAEALHRLGVRTSRCLSLIETGESLWRGDEPSPTRSSVMVRFSRSHIRFGTFERLHYFKRKDLITILLEHVIEHYYTHLANQSNRYACFYAELVHRVADLAAQWMAAGFCHGVLNTDNMSITGESFDYGPYAFIPTYSPGFTAAYFDYSGLYSYGNQPGICRKNLETLQQPLAFAIAQVDLESGLALFDQAYKSAYQQLMLGKLGFRQTEFPEAEELLNLTVHLLKETQVDYHRFFSELTNQFSGDWRDDVNNIFRDTVISNDELAPLWNRWKVMYFNLLLSLPDEAMVDVKTHLQANNPTVVPVRPLIEAAWKPIVEADDWTTFYDLLQQIRAT